MRRVGLEGEKRAREFLISKGLKIISTNFHSRFGEIDIIAKSGEGIHFIEVKSTKHEDALERITPSKIDKIIKTINYYQMKNPFSSNYQIDAIVVNPKGVEWIQNIVN